MPPEFDRILRVVKDAAVNWEARLPGVLGGVAIVLLRLRRPGRGKCSSSKGYLMMSVH